MYFVIKIDVINPEDCSIIYEKGCVIDPEMFAYLGEEYGIDNVDAYVCANYRAAVIMSKGL